MSERPDHLTNTDKRRVDALFFPMQFDDLLQIATETCLSEPLPDIAAPTLSNPEARVVQQLGYHGLRTALEIELANPSTYDMRNILRDREASDNENAVYYDTAMKYTAFFSDEVHQEYIARAQQLGDALMRESFAILGPDANDQLEKFMTAGTKEVQLEVMSWLNRRCRELIEDVNLSEEPENDPLLYHPARLSPKLIGEYPHHMLPPTCLGVSIIAAEFFRRAGCQTLQAGVMCSHNESGLEATLGLMRIQQFHRSQGGHVTLLEEDLQKKVTEVYNRLHQDNGYHAAVYAKLPSGWLQFDSNFNSTCLLDGAASDRLQRTFDTLTGIEEVAPGMEVAVELAHAFSLSLLSIEYIEELTECSTRLDEVLADVLVTGESVVQRIFDEYVLPVFMQPTHRATTTVAQRYIKDLQKAASHESGLQDVFYKIFEKYVLWGQPLETVIARCRSDAAFFRRFKEDIEQALPTVLVQLCLIEWDAQSIEPTGPHQTIEAGLPETRIGMSVLNDFAQYCEGTLPPSFWFSHWPSQAVVTEMMRDDLPVQQAAILWNNVVLNRESLLTYNKSNGMVEKFVERSTVK